jgi:alpha-L-arabinofuranosidase
LKGSYLTTSDNQKYVKTIASKSEDQIAILVMNQDQTTDFDFDIMLNKIGKSNKPLAIIADAALDVNFSGHVENQTSMLFVFDSKGILKKQIIYGLRHNLKNMKPDIK